MDFDGQKSAWDGRQLYVQELANIRKGLHVSRLEHNVQRRYDFLVCYFQALIARIPQKASKKKSNDKVNDQFSTQIEYYKKIKDHMSKYRAHVAKEKRYDGTDEMLDLFDEWEVVLRQAENDMGLLMPSEDDAELAILQ